MPNATRSNPDASPSIAYERVSVLFNLAAYYSQLGKRQTITSGDGLKTASNAYQNAAGVFLYLTDITREYGVDGISSDLCSENLKMMELLTLAQAQECFYLKAVLGALHTRPR